MVLLFVGIGIVIIAFLISVILFKISKNQCRKNMLFISKLSMILILLFFKFGVS